jgi:hypothetical protein
MGAGSVTLSFFARADEEEATGYQNVVLDDAAAGASAELGFDSFDKIPRRRRPLFVVAGSLSLLVMGVLAWRAGHGIGRGSSIADAARAMVGGQPAHAVALVPAMPVPAMPVPVMPVPATPVAVTPVAALPVAAPPVVMAEPAAAIPAASPAGAVPTERAPRRPIKIEEPSGSRSAPLRGYVWSPETKRLVPVEDATAAPAPDVDPTPEPSGAVPARAFGIAPAQTTPPAFESRRAPTEGFPIVE